MSIKKLEESFDMIQMIRNTVTTSNEKLLISGAEALIMEVLHREGCKLSYNRNKTHPTDIINLCDSIKVNIKQSLKTDYLLNHEYMLRDIINTVIKVKFIINEKI